MIAMQEQLAGGGGEGYYTTLLSEEFRARSL